MNILAIDTTTRIAAISISNNDKVFNNLVDNEITHSEKLLPLIDTTLKSSKLNLKDINMFACINGPGSFTGIRIGLSTLKAFAQVYKQDIFSMSSLSVIAYSTYILEELNTMYCISLVDARNDRVYYNMSKLYRSENNKIIIEEIFDTSNDLIDDAITNLNTFISSENINKDALHISGNAINKFSDRLSSISRNQHDFYPNPETLIHAIQNIAKIENYTFNAFTLDAMYARPSQAERMQNNG